MAFAQQGEAAAARCRNHVLGAMTLGPLLVVLTSVCAEAQEQPSLPSPVTERLRDRGEGLPTSMFGTYVRKGEFLLYPFFEYYHDADFEYSPEELGFVGDVDYRGRYRAQEGLLFLAYGLTDNLAVEFEAAIISASLDKAPADPSALPVRTTESGLGDIEGQIRWRWRKETGDGPEVFSFTEIVVPHHQEKILIGTPGWEMKFGTGVIRGFGWGTLTARAAVAYDEASSSHFDSGEYAIEYLKRLSQTWRLYAGIEGEQDEVSLIGEMQWHITPRIIARFNTGVGLTSKATDWAPEVGIVFAFGPW
jgi:hypothetical protein